MQCSCCGPSNAAPPRETEQGNAASDSFPQPDVASSLRGNDGAGKKLDESTESHCDNDHAPSEKPCQVGCRGSDSTNSERIENNANNAAHSTNAQTDVCREGDTSYHPPGETCWESCAGDSCNGQSTKPACDSGISSCCATSEKPCADGDSSTPSLSGPAISPEQATAECCRGKPRPCCNESCLDRLALRECDSELSKPEEKATQHVSSSTGQCEALPRRPCDRHRRSVRDQYASKLAALGCICRALLALGQESCCEPRGRRFPPRKDCAGRSSKESLTRVSVDSCCASGSSKGQSLGRHSSEGRKRGGVRCAEKRVRKGCSVRATSGGDCCAPENLSCASKNAAGTEDTACADSCCTSGKPCLAEAKKGPDTSTLPDPEGRGTGVEHVVLSISGMTCTGCETKLTRTLATLAGVRNLKTSLVLSRAEFDVDLGLSTVEQVMKHLEHTTEFKSERITKYGSSMDIVVSEDPSTFVNRAWPVGVTDISLADKDIVRVAFDPTMVGARDLIVNHWAGVARLAPVNGDPALAAGSKHVLHMGYMTLLSAVLTIPVLVMAWAPIPEREIAYGSASLALATLVQVVIAGPFYPNAMKALVFSRVIEMDLLIVLSTSAAYIFSVFSFGYLVAGRPLATGQFFETSTLLVTLIMVGRYVAALARQKAVESISIQSLQTQAAILVEYPNSLETREIDVRLLQYGDIFKVLPDSRIPTDGTILSGSSEVNESMLTGESRPVEKGPETYVIAGTLNGSGTLIAQLTRLPGDNTINAIAAMVDEAKLSKPKMQELADKVASYFVPVIVGLTVITFLIWIAVGIAVQGKSGSSAAVQSITYAITVLIVSCPCAIGLAVPMVIVIASGIAAERGVVFKSAGAIELAHKTSHVVLDKMGTLTQGRPSVAVAHQLQKEDSLSLLFGLVSNSKHPVSAAVGDHLRRRGVVATATPDVQSLPGRGLETRWADQMVQAGNARWLNTATNPLVESMLKQGYTAFCFCIDGLLCAVFGVEDSLRDDASDVVAQLQKHGVSVHVVSGDDEGPVQSVALSLGIPRSNVHARSSPADKKAYIMNLLGDCADVKKPIVIFCGDGTNDAVALAQATIGIHMNEGSDIAQSAADVVLMRPALSGLLTVIDVSKASVRRIRFNFGWSFVYNTFAVLLAAGAFGNARIPPEFAGLGELVSVLPVIVAAVLLRWARI